MTTRVVEPAAIARGATLLVTAAERGAGGWSAQLLAGTEVTILLSREPDKVLSAVANGSVDVVLVTSEMAGGTEAALTLIARIAARQDVPVVAAVSDALSHGAAERAGAADFVVAQPADRAEVLRATRRVLLLMHGSMGSPLRHVGTTADNPLLGEARSMKKLRGLIDRAAPGTATILIRGETGTGKELVAGAVHRRSDRSGGPMVTVNCAALPDALLESELFGYEKGAFTGAQARKLGRLEHAEGGTLFLDEIGDITPTVQVKLLRVLQERTFERLGGHQTLKADVRFIAATHRDLDAMVKAGTFREDLFYRLNVVPLWVPPLRARRADVVLLAGHFCTQFAARNGKHGMRLDDGALQYIRAHRWPGNVRQLQNMIERLVVLTPGRVIGEEDFRREAVGGSPFVTEVSDANSVSISVGEGGGLEAVLPLDQEVRRAERRAIERALKAADGNRSKAARLLGVSRATLYNKMKEHAKNEGASSG